jgi:hypothetical protein
MPVKSQKQFRFMKAVENNPEFADKVNVDEQLNASSAPVIISDVGNSLTMTVVLLLVFTHPKSFVIITL